MAATLTDTIKGVATEALDLKVQIDALNKELDARKEQLRQFANKDLLEITVDGKGKVRVSKPRDGSEEQVLVVNEAKLNSVPELKTKLLEKGVIQKTTKKVAAAKASVTVEPNV